MLERESFANASFDYHKAIIVACLGSFRQLYTNSQGRRRLAEEPIENNNSNSNNSRLITFFSTFRSRLPFSNRKSPHGLFSSFPSFPYRKSKSKNKSDKSNNNDDDASSDGNKRLITSPTSTSTTKRQESLSLSSSSSGEAPVISPDVIYIGPSFDLASFFIEIGKEGWHARDEEAHWEGREKWTTNIK